MPLYPTSRHAPVAAEDQAKVIVNILDNPLEHAGKIYSLFGAKELDQNEIAKTVGKALGLTVRYKQVPTAVFVHDVSDSGCARQHLQKEGQAKEDHPKVEFLIQHVAEVAIDHENGIFSGTNDVVARIGGSEPLTVEERLHPQPRLF